MSSAKTESVQAAIASIRQFHKLGRSLPKKDEHGKTYGKAVIASEQERLRVNEDTLRKARHFADPHEGFSRIELNELCRVIRETQSSQPESWKVFSRSHLTRLLSVRRRRDRAALQTEAIRNGWSTAELEREIVKRFGTRREGGRRRRIPTDVVDLLAELEVKCEEWRRWHKELSREADELDQRHVLLSDLGDDLAKQIEVASRSVKKLHKVVTEELRRLRPDRVIRGALQSD